MQKRIITGIIGIIFLFVIIYYSTNLIFNTFIFIVLAISHYEFYNLFEKRNNFYFFTSCIIAILFIYFFSFKGNIEIFPLIIFFLFSFCLFITSTKKDYNNIYEILKFIIANIYISFFLSLSIPIFSSNKGRDLIMFILLIAWSTDSFAYFTGIKLGQRKLCPKISPNKTVEGAIGGIVGAIIIGIIFNYFVLKFQLLPTLLGILILSISCILGDLFESSLKRFNNKKDSGNIFPGHGGMLDRIDSLFFAVPVFYILYNTLWQ